MTFELEKSNIYKKEGWHITFSKEMSARIAMVYAECTRGKRLKLEKSNV